MVVISKEQLKLSLVNNCIKLFLGIKIISTIFLFFGFIFEEGTLLLGTGLFSLFYISAWSYSVESMSKILAGTILLAWALLPILWIIFYLIFCFSKKKGWKRAAIVFFIAANLLDVVCVIMSIRVSFAPFKVYALIFQAIVVLLPIVLCVQQFLYNHKKDSLSVQQTL